jgi:hypothetical protein
MLMGSGDYTGALRHSGLVKYVRNGGDAFKSVVTDFAALDVFNVPSWGPVDGPDGAQLIAYAQRVAAAHGLGVYQFHGVGGDYLSVSAEAHHELVRFLKSHPEIWVGTFQQVLEYSTAHTTRRASVDSSSSALDASSSMKDTRGAQAERVRFSTAMN